MKDETEFNLAREGAMSEGTTSGFRFDLREASGALGDIGTLLPLTLGMIALVGLPAQQVLAGFGLFYIATGLIYRLPIPVQPMKAIAAVALASEVSPAALALSGVLIGGVLLGLGGSGLIDRLARLVPQSVLSGLQLGLGLALGWIALGLMAEQAPIGAASLAVAAFMLRFGRHAALVTLMLGAALGLWLGVPGAAGPGAQIGLPGLPAPGDLRIALADLALPQLALTLTNAVFLTALVAGDAFGPRAAHVTPRKLCLSSGAANLLLAPLGAVPMCHGAGGVAAHHRFGARTGGAPVMLGAALLLLALLPAPLRQSALSAIPAATLGALLLIAAVELAASRRLIDARPSCRPVIAAAALGTVLANPLVGLIAGTGAEILRKLWLRHRAPQGR
ncbi:putative sulfate/molybdate transporter [Marivita sp. GX14005]|uniref:putative sulfate/molybdate transporter n=1 Tax=Marivita sp. GX14005 TaxID=2942276 RepID=UPI002019B431|nr:putative sulfate/molybdate transporter [Marivita sp. GX14005]MCL3883958.1 putative sulfate/molybdate transporter [Marivita sp. GX14005]